MTTMGNLPEVVSREEWLAARKELLAKEKELTRARDRVNADRRRLPMVRDGQAVHVRGPGRDGQPARPVRGPAAAGDAPLHVRPGLGRRPARAVPPPPTGSAGCGSCTCATPRSSRCRGRRTRSSPRSASGWAGRSPGTPRTAATSTTTSTPPSTTGSRRCCSTSAPRPSSPRPEPRGRADRGRRHARRGDAGHQRVPAGRRRGLPHLLHVRPRHRGVPQRLPRTSTSPPSAARRRGRNRRDARPHSACRSAVPRCACPTNTASDDCHTLQTIRR